MEKSSIYFSSNTKVEQGEWIKNNLGVKEVGKFESYLGVFQLSVKFCNELNAMCTRFWWGQVGNERKIHWRSWDMLSTSKKEEGMGFCDIQSFNLAMPTKQGWRLMQGKDSLLFRCFKAKYFPRCGFLDAVDVPNSSYVWKRILVA